MSFRGIAGSFGLWVLACGSLLALSGQSSASAAESGGGNAAKLTTEKPATDPKDLGNDANRLDDSYEPKGVEMGQFLFLPKVEADETYNSNVFATQSDAKGDFINVLRPVLALRSRFSQHELNMSAQAERYTFHRYSSDDRTEAQFNLDGRLDISDATQAYALSQLFARHEDRGSPDDQHGSKPTPYDGAVNRLGLKHQFGKTSLLGEVGGDRSQYGSVSTSTGTQIDNGDRDRWEMSARERASYEFMDGYAAVLELGENSRQYDRSHDRNGYERDSSGYRAETGIGVDISQLVRGDFLVGYFKQDYKDPRFHDPSGGSLRAAFNWTPTKLTLVVPALERAVYETTTQGASGLVRNSASLMVRHELQRNVILTGFSSVNYDQMSGISGQDAWTYEVRGRVTYAFTPEVYVGGELAYRNKDSQLSENGFAQTTAMIRLGLQY